jgi:indole-3-glycerol phosphate synthase
MSSSTVLARIVGETRAEVRRRRRERPLESIAPSVAPAPAHSFRDALAAPGIGVIAEFKRRSPSAGALAEAPDLAATLAAYAEGGAVAASILTEGPNFEGALEDLLTARGACRLPLLRKDFIVDPYQLHESRAAGAAAVLLIAAALSSLELAQLHAHALELELDVLVEVHDREELARALEVGPEIVGVNNRDLRDFSVDLERTESLMDEMPAGVLVVSESGIRSPEQLQRLARRGVHAVLVGETLMRASDPAEALRGLASGSPQLL